MWPARQASASRAKTPDNHYVGLALQDDKEELQQVQLELQRREAALQRLQPPPGQDADGAATGDAPQQPHPALQVMLDPLNPKP